MDSAEDVVRELPNSSVLSLMTRTMSTPLNVKTRSFEIVRLIQEVSRCNNDARLAYEGTDWRCKGSDS